MSTAPIDEAGLTDQESVAVTHLATERAIALLNALESRLELSSTGTPSDRARAALVKVSPQHNAAMTLADSLRLVQSVTIRLKHDELEQIDGDAWPKCAQAASTIFFAVCAGGLRVERADYCVRLHEMTLDGRTRILCGLIVCANLGGQLRLVQGRKPRVPEAQAVHLIRLEDLGDVTPSERWSAFVRRVFFAVMRAHDPAQSIAVLDATGPLTDQQLADLQEVIRTTREDHRSAFALVVRSAELDEPVARSGAMENQWPLILLGAEGAVDFEKLFGLKATELLAIVANFCSIVHPYFGDPMSEPRQERPSGEASGAGNGGPNFQGASIHGPVLVQTGENSTAAQGPGATAIGRQTVTTITNYAEGIEQLRRKIDDAIKLNVQDEVKAELGRLMEEIEKEGSEPPATSEAKARVSKLLGQVQRLATNIDAWQTVAGAALALSSFLKSPGLKSLGS